VDSIVQWLPIVSEARGHERERKCDLSAPCTWIRLHDVILRVERRDMTTLAPRSTALSCSKKAMRPRLVALAILTLVRLLAREGCPDVNTSNQCGLA
jgi:hypothetical protein